MGKPWMLAGVLTIGLVPLGCATIGHTEPVVSEQPVKTLREAVRVQGVRARVDQDDTSFHLEAKHQCGLQKRQVIEKVTRTENRNDSPVADWGWGLLGITVGTAGAIMIADAESVYPNDKESRTYNPQGPDKARLYGAGLAALGATCLTVALIDVVRANGATEDSQEITKAPVMVKRDVPCQKPYANAAVTAHIGEKAFDIGKTNAKGTFDADLDEAIEPSFAPPSKGIILVKVDDNEAAQIDIEPLFKKREERAWRSLRGTKCAEPIAPTACDDFKRFLAEYPHGPHAAKARKIVDEGAPVIFRMEEAAAWTGLDLPACSTGKPQQDVNEATAACSSVEGFLSRFAEGPHGKEAASALRKGKARVAAIEARLAGEAKAAEAKLERERKAAEAKERAAQEAEARQARVEEQRKRDCPRNCAAKAGGYGSSGTNDCVQLECEGDNPACASKCAAECGGYRNSTCITACNKIECEIGGNTCTRGCAAKCGGYGNTRCVGQCVFYECKIDPRY